MAVRISRAVLDAIMADAQTTPSLERCGLLFGGNECITGWRSAANVHPEPARHFELDPMVLIAAARAAREGQGPAIVGHSHSHPAGEAVPSKADAAAAAGDGRLWLIVGSGGCRLWRSISGSHAAVGLARQLWLGKFVEEEIEAVD